MALAIGLLLSVDLTTLTTITPPPSPLLPFLAVPFLFLPLPTPLVAPGSATA